MLELRHLRWQDKNKIKFVILRDDKSVLKVVDNTNATWRMYPNELVISLKTQTLLIGCFANDGCASSINITYTAEDILRQTGKKRENFALPLTNAAE